MQHFHTVNHSSLTLCWLQLSLVLLKAELKTFLKYFCQTLQTSLGMNSGCCK